MKIKKSIFRSYSKESVWNRVLDFWAHFNGDLSMDGFLSITPRKDIALQEGFEFTILSTAFVDIEGEISTFDPNEGSLKFGLKTSAGEFYRTYSYQIEDQGPDQCRISMEFELKTGNPVKLIILSMSRSFWLKPFFRSIGG